MCTLVIASRLYPKTPLLVFANRDEHLARPSAPPAELEHQGHRIWAPRDLKAGGTWLGVNEAGLFVGLTNRFTGGASASSDRRSRGLLVLDLLTSSGVEEARRAVEALSPQDYEPYHLMLASRDELVRVVHDGRSPRVEALEPGIHIVSESSFGARESSRDRKVAELLALESVRREEPSTEQIGRVLAHHDPGGAPLASICVHAPEVGYGTRSSTIIRFGEEGVVAQHADGPPCTHGYSSARSIL